MPVVVLACLARYRPPNPYEGNSVYPACQNLLLGARAIGLGGCCPGCDELVLIADLLSDALEARP